MYEILIGLLLFVNILYNVIYIYNYNRQEWLLDFGTRPLWYRIPAYAWYWLAALYYHRILPYIIRLLLASGIVFTTFLIFWRFANPNNVFVIGIPCYLTIVISIGYSIDKATEMCTYLQQRKKKIKTNENKKEV